MKTKKDLIEENKKLKEILEDEKQRPLGHTITNCNINMSKQEEYKLAAAKAVEEGMKALRAIGESNTYGIYFDGK